MPDLAKYVVAALVGAVVATIAGYFVYASAQGGEAWTFYYWITGPFRFGSWPWPLVGAAVGAGARYAFR